jgi:quercetin dioxygenase-like cupin family protein
MLTPADLKWGPAPPVLPPGAQVAILDGDPFTPGFYALRLKMPDGYKIAPHWHPTDENVVVLQGTLGLGMGTTLNPAAAKKLTPGSFTRLPSEMRHYAIANGETILQIYGQGPFEIKYVNPKDDPSKKQ